MNVNAGYSTVVLASVVGVSPGPLPGYNRHG